MPGGGCRVLVGRAQRRDPATLDTPTASSPPTTGRQVRDHVGRSAQRGASPHALGSLVACELPPPSVGRGGRLWRRISTSRASRATSSAGRGRCATRAQTDVFESRGHDQPLADANGRELSDLHAAARSLERARHDRLRRARDAKIHAHHQSQKQPVSHSEDHAIRREKMQINNTNRVLHDRCICIAQDRSARSAKKKIRPLRRS